MSSKKLSKANKTRQSQPLGWYFHFQPDASLTLFSKHKSSNNEV